MEENKKKRSYKKLVMLCLLSAGVVLTAFGGTLAYYNDTLNLKNPLKTSNTSVAMIEDFNPNQSFLPGETAVKKVFFQNEGDMDLFLRVEVLPEEGWYQQDGETLLNPDDPLYKEYTPDKVIKNWSTDWASGLDSDADSLKSGTSLSEVRTQINKTDDDYKANPLDVLQSKWPETPLWSRAYAQTGSDGQEHYYRYYKKILTAEGVDSKTPEILKSITLVKTVSNDRHKEDFSNKIYKLTFNAQAVPVEADKELHAENQLGVEQEWKMKVQINSNGLTWKPVSP